MRIGGPGHTVEIDESAFVRRKHNVGREGFLVAVDQRDAGTLLPVLQDYVSPGYNSCVRFVGSLPDNQQFGLPALDVNHSIHFVDPVMHVTTNHVESIWCKAKQCNKRKCGTHRTLLTSYLIEFMWRQKFGDDPFQNLLEHIREIYLCKYLIKCMLIVSNF